MSKKLVIDTDGVADDVRAISLAIQHPDVEVLAITTVIGCVNVTQATANVARTLRANGLQTDSIPIYRGAAEPLIGNNHDPTHEAHFFGEDGIGGKPEEFPSVEYNDFNAAVEDVHAASALIKLFREHKSEAILVCLGPLTNVALALKLEPEFASWPKSVHVMGGNLFGAGNVKSYSTAEFNFSNDPEAAHIVIEKMKVPLTVVPWECFLFPSVDSTVDFHAHLELDAPLAKFFSTATSVGRAALEPSGVQYAYCDEITMASAICPDVILEKRELRGTVELHGSITRGQLALDWTERLWSDVFLASGKFCDKRPKITFVEKYDIPLLDKMIREAVLNSAKPQSEE